MRLQSYVISLYHVTPVMTASGLRNIIGNDYRQKQIGFVDLHTFMDGPAVIMLRHNHVHISRYYAIKCIFNMFHLTKYITFGKWLLTSWLSFHGFVIS